MAIVSGATSPTRGPSLESTLGYEGITSVLVRDVGSKIFYLDPSAAPFTLLTDRAGSKPATNVRFEWYEKALRPNASVTNGATADTTTATFATATPTYYRIYDLVLDATTSEILKVTATPASSDTTVAVTRGAAGSTAANIGSGDDLFIIGSAFPEGMDVPTPDEWQESAVYNFTQIFRDSFGASETRENTETYFGTTRSKLRAEWAIEHALRIERAYLFGDRAEVTTANAPYRTTRGFVNWATSNGLDLSGSSLSEPDLEGWMEDLFAHTTSGDSRLLLCAPLVITAIDQLAVDKIQLVPSDQTYGITVRQYATAHGVLNIVKHRLLVNGAGGYGHGDWALAVDPKMLVNRPLSGRTTKLLMNRQSPGTDGWVDEYLTECGLQFSNPEVHGILKNVGAAA